MQSDDLCQSAVSWFFFSRGVIVHQSGLLDHLVAGDMILALNPEHRCTWCACSHYTILEKWNVYRK